MLRDKQSLSLRDTRHAIRDTTGGRYNILSERPILALMGFLVLTTAMLVSGTIFVVRASGHVEIVEGERAYIAANGGQLVSTTETKLLPRDRQGAPGTSGQPPTLRLRRHKLQGGENLWTVAQQYGVDMKTIIGCNEGLSEDGVLQAGRELVVPNQKGVFYRLKFGQTLSDLSWAFNVRLEAIMRANGIVNPATIKNGDAIFLPGADPLEPRSKRLKVLESRVVDTTFYTPLRGRLTQRFGWRIHPIRKKRDFHRAIDIAAIWGSKVKAAQSGKVTFAGWKAGYGYFVRIKHDFGYETCYGHLTNPLHVEKGETVKRGQVIGRTGQTGTATGSHLHFEIWKDGRAVNPLRYMQWSGTARKQ